MAKILLGDIPLLSWELDAFSKALFPILCRSLGVSFLEDSEGNFILNPPLANKTIVLHPLAGQDPTLTSLLTTLSQELQGQGASVLIVPATTSDGQLFRLWQTQVLFAFSQKDTAGSEPALRFFYSPKRREESLGLIAALVQTMLRSGSPLSYTIPGAWERFKNFRYRRLLNNAEVPSILIEFCQVHLEAEFIHNITTWLVEGLTWYFQKPLAEETIFKLQSLLQRFRDAFLLPGLPEGNNSRESKTIPGQDEVLAKKSQDISREPQYQASATEQVKKETAPSEGEPIAKPPAGPSDVPIQIGEKRDAEPGTIEGAARKENGGKIIEAVTITSTGEDSEAEATTNLDKAAIPGRSEMQVQAGLPEQDQEQGRGGVAEQAKKSPPNELVTTERHVNQGATTAKDSVSRSLVSPSAPSGQIHNVRKGKGRHRGNPFSPPGDGPVFIFKRPLDASLDPSIFPREVLERMATLPLQRTFLMKQWSNDPASPVADTTMASLTAWQASQPGAAKPSALNFEPIRRDLIDPENRSNDSTLMELKNLSVAILAPEQPGEPINGEAPSI